MKYFPYCSIRFFELALFFAALSCNAATIQGRVVGVADGDTITVLDTNKVQHKIRLAGIDAPEKKQLFGNSSKESLSELAYDKIVTVETDKRDKYGRQVGKVLVNGQDVNLVQVERGMAWFYRQYQREQSPNDRRLYEAAEDAAKADNRGLWRGADPMPPWDFRHKKIIPSNIPTLAAPLSAGMSCPFRIALFHTYFIPKRFWQEKST